MLSDGCLVHGTAGPTSIDAMQCHLEELVSASARVSVKRKEKISRQLSDHDVDTVADWLALSNQDLTSMLFQVVTRASIDSAIRVGTLVSVDSTSGYIIICDQSPASCCSIP